MLEDNVLEIRAYPRITSEIPQLTNNKNWLYLILFTSITLLNSDSLTVVSVSFDIVSPASPSFANLFYYSILLSKK